MPWDIKEDEDDKPPEYHEHPLKKYTNKAVVKRYSTPFANLVSRTDWGAVPPTSVEPLILDAPPFLQKPNPIANHIYFSHAGEEECNDRQECSRLLRSIQQRHMANGEPDINASFLVGGDGNVYEGRGWSAMVNVPEDFTTPHTASSIVAAIGDFSKKKPPKIMIDIMKKFFTWSIVNNKLGCCFWKTFNFELHNMYYK